MAFESYVSKGLQETPVPSAARTTSADTGPLNGYGIATTLRAQLNVTEAAGTTPTLNVVIEDSVDNGATWNPIGTFAEKTAAGREVLNVTTPFTGMLRVRWTVGGTTPSFTFAVDWYAE